MTMQANVTRYADQVQFSARIKDILSGCIPAENAADSVHVPGRVTSLERLDDGRMGGALWDAGHTLPFTAPEPLLRDTRAFDIVILSGRLSNTGSGLALEVDGVKTITPSFVCAASPASWAKEPIDKRRALPEYDFIFDTDRGKALQLRPRLIKATRQFLQEQGFLEVDTPFLVPYPDIAPVPPVRISDGQHVPAGDLRIANTEFMRRLLVSGFDRIYQLGRCFRDEKPSPKHEIEFTQLTFGISFATYETLMDLIEKLICHLLSSIGRRDYVITYQGKIIAFNPPWPRVTVQRGLMGVMGINVLACRNQADLEQAIRNAGYQVPKVASGYGGMLAQARLLDAVIDEYLVPTFDGPTWLCEYPYYLGGPAKEILDRPQVKMRAELFVKGMEIANISVPQNDPTKVRAWYEQMFQLKCEKGWDTPYLDEPYLHSMEIGIPVATTGGLGFDRLLMILLDAADIRDVVLFPSGAQYSFERRGSS